MARILKTETIRPPAAGKQNTLNLLGGEKELTASVSWVSADDTCDLDLSCCLFDAKGHVMEQIDFNNVKSDCNSVWSTGDTVGANMEGDGVEREEMSFSLKRLNPACQVILLWVTSFKANFKTQKVRSISSALYQYVFAESQRPNARQISDWSTRPLKEKNRLVFDVIDLDPEAKDNALFLFKLFRLPESGEWAVHRMLRTVSMAGKQEVKVNMHACICDYFPWLRRDEQRLINDVQQLCGSLSSKTMPKLKVFFLQNEVGGEIAGLKVDKFTDILLKQMLQLEGLQGLKEPVECAHTVALIHELFNQIDINGDEEVDWEEFTSFCIEIGMLATHQDDRSEMDEFVVEYIEDTSFMDTTITGLKTVVCMVEAHDLGRIIIVESESFTFKVYDKAGNYLHEHEIAPHEEEEKEIDLHPPGKRTVPGRPIVTKDPHIHDLAYIPEHQLIAVSGSNHVIYLFREVLSSAGQHKCYEIDTLITFKGLRREDICFQDKLAWAPVADILFSIDSNLDMHMWKPLNADEINLAAPRPVQTIHPHTDVIMDFLYIKDRGLFATCSLDKKIILWGIDNMRERGRLLGHTLGVRKMAYANGILVSVGFEYDGIAWDLSSKCSLLRLRGHRHAINSVRTLYLNYEHTPKCITQDDFGDFRLWELVGDKTGTGSAVCLQTFRVPNQESVGLVQAIALPYSANLSINEFSEMLVGGPGSKLFRMVPQKRMKEFVPPTTAYYNKASGHLLSGVGNTLYQWDMRNGNFLRKFTKVHAANNGDICAFCLDRPRERRVFLGFENGFLTTINYVTGQIMNNMKLHDRDITGVMFCEKTKVLMTVGLDSQICVLRQNRSAVSLLRSIANTHGGTGITAASYHYILGVIITGGGDSKICFWDFQNLAKRCVIKGLEKGVTALSMARELPLFYSCDGAGNIRLWRFFFQTDTAECLCRFTIHSSRWYTHNHVKPNVVSSDVLWEGVPKILGGTDTGHLHVWDCVSLGERFPDMYEPLPEELHPEKRLSYRPYLKLPEKDDSQKKRPSQGQSMEEVATEKVELVVQPQMHVERTKLCPRQGFAHGEAIQVCFFLVFGKTWYIYSTSHDGYQKIWALTGGIMGELRLPNMEIDTDRKQVEWELTGEKVEVTDEHREVANRILGRNATVKKFQGVMSKIGKLGQSASAPALPSVMVSGSPGGSSGGSSEGGGSGGLGGFDPGKIEIAAEDLEFYKKFAEERKNRKQAAGMTVLAGTGKAIGFGSKQSKSARHRELLEQVKIKSPGGDASVDLSESADASLVGQYAPVAAFSDISIRSGLQSGYYDFMAYQHLKAVSRFQERREAYDRAFPLIKPVESVQRFKIQQRSRNKLMDTDDSVREFCRKPPSSHEFTIDDLLGSNQEPEEIKQRVLIKNDNGQIKVIGLGSHDRSMDASPTPAGSLQEIKARAQALLDNEAKQAEAESALEAKMAHQEAERQERQNKHRKAQAWNRRKSVSASVFLKDAEEGKTIDDFEMIDFSSVRKGAFGPHYSLAEVMRFRTNFNSVDVDMSGQLDMNEWVTFLNRMNKKMNTTEAQLLFMHIDKDRSGTIDMQELIPIIFDSGSRDQHQLMYKVILSENAKRVRREVDNVTKEDLRALFCEFVRPDFPSPPSPCAIAN